MPQARDGRGDRERAQALLVAAQSTYHQLGMESNAASAATLAREVATTT